MTNEMTAEEAIRWLDAIKKYYIHGGDEAYDKKRMKAIDMAIKALEKQQDELVECDRTSEAHPTHGSTYGGVSWGGTYKEEAQPTDASPWGTKLGTWIERTVIHKDEAKEAIEEWQSARCSVCGKYHTTPYMYYFDEFKFCPNCGSYMGGGEDG